MYTKTPPSMGTNPINELNKGGETIFYKQISLWPKWVKKRSFQPLDGQLLIFKDDSILGLPNSPKNAKRSRSPNKLVLLSLKGTSPTQ